MNFKYKRRLGWLMTFCVLLSALSLSSCRKLVETTPPTDQVTETNVFSTDATAISALNNIYIGMSQNFSAIQGYSGVSMITGLSSDELTLYNGIVSGGLYDYYVNDLSIARGSGFDFWTPMYNYILKCNAAIEGLSSEKSSGLTNGVRKQLLGEALSLRAFFYFHLSNLFGDVPLCLTTDPQANTLLHRAGQFDVYRQIISDLKRAEENLKDNFPDKDITGSSGERVRPTVWAAKALLARMYLYTKDYTNAELKANEVINNTGLFEIKPLLNDVFLKNSREAIWQIQPTTAFYNTAEAQTFVLPDYGPDAFGYNPVYLSSNLFNSFEPGDLRGKPKNWIDTLRVGPDFYYYPYKYKLNQQDGNITASSGTSKMKEYFMVLRLAEQYLIRAEARAKLGNIAGAQADLNLIRQRAGLGDTPANDQSSLLTAILHERQVELFTEMGQRWYDLKRTEKVNEVMTVATAQKSGGTGTWQSFQQFYPISVSELQRAPNLRQTAGY